MMFWNRIFKDPRPEDTTGEYTLQATGRIEAIDSVSLAACGNGRWA